MTPGGRAAEARHKDKEAWNTGDGAARMRGAASSPGPPLGAVLGKATGRALSPSQRAIGRGTGEGAQKLQDWVETSRPLQEGGCGRGREVGAGRKPEPLPGHVQVIPSQHTRTDRGKRSFLQGEMKRKSVFLRERFYLLTALKILLSPKYR